MSEIQWLGLAVACVLGFAVGIATPVPPVARRAIAALGRLADRLGGPSASERYAESDRIADDAAGCTFPDCSAYPPRLRVRRALRELLAAKPTPEPDVAEWSEWQAFEAQDGTQYRARYRTR